MTSAFASKPPIAGEPIITAITTIIPKVTPTMTNRSIHIKISHHPVKK